MVNNIKWLSPGLMLIALCSLARADETTVTTFYPAPYGAYQDLDTDGNTTLATNAMTPANTNVGIGTGNQTLRGKLDVSWGPTGVSGAMGSNRWMQVGNPAGNDEAKFWLQLFDNGASAEAPIVVLSDENEAPRIQMQQWGATNENNPDNYVTIGHSGGLTNDMRITSAAGAVNVGIGTASINRKAPEGNIDVNDVYMADTASWASQSGGGSAQVATGTYVGDLCLPGPRLIAVPFQPDYLILVMSGGGVGYFAVTTAGMGGFSYVQSNGLVNTQTFLVAGGFTVDSVFCALPESDAPGAFFYWHASKG